MCNNCHTRTNVLYFFFVVFFLHLLVNKKYIKSNNNKIKSQTTRFESRSTLQRCQHWEFPNYDTERVSVFVAESEPESE